MDSKQETSKSEVVKVVDMLFDATVGSLGRLHLISVMLHH